MKYSTAEIREMIDRCPASVLESIISEYIHDARNREIIKRKLLQGVAYEPLSEAYGITPRQCFNIVKAGKQVIVDHLNG